MANPLIALGDFLTVGASAGANVISALGQKEAQEKAYEKEIKELEYKAAQEKKAAAQATASMSKNLFNSDLTKNIVLWGVTTVAGGVLVAAVLKAAGIK